ncbi:MAG: AAA family ATPase [Desulfomonile tiedjei]|nr:AAA family ATPase [Desulfomonile tiedjei]
MFPIEFDHAILDTLPLTTEEDVKRVVHIVNATISRRIMPYFRKNRGTDAITMARVAENLSIERLEDEDKRVRCVSLTTRKDQGWVIHIHERVFDYLAFVIPTHPEARLGDGSPEEHKVLAFFEFLLRHEIEHLLYPQRTEREVIDSDIVFAADRRVTDPTFYRMLRSSLSDELNGLKGAQFAALLDLVEREQPYRSSIDDILTLYVDILVDLPEGLLEQVFPIQDKDVKTRILGTCFRRSRDTTYSLLKRTTFLQQLLRLFELLVIDGNHVAEDVFNAFKDRWGLVALLHELGIPESSVEHRSIPEIFQVFKETLRRFSQETQGLFGGIPVAPAAAYVAPKTPAPLPVKTLKDRIDEAHADSRIPPQVLEAIDKNKLNAVGHSGSKYSEFIETLLAIPWGKIQQIGVSPEAFEDGLDRSHYGLAKPKEIICDFFTNLIWRYRSFTEESAATWRTNGSAFLFVGPPGVGKTSLAISIAQNLGIPYHKLSLGGMRDEADLRGHGFTYEGSKPGAIVQGLIKMGVTNGMFIMDEADKVEKFAIATLLEILDPEQNHLFHDKYTQTTIDVDLSNCHFILTANTLETVPAPVVNRCEVVMLDRYSIEEKVSIARQHLIGRVREKYQISGEYILLDPTQETGLFRYLIKTYTHEAGVRELERIIRTLFLRIFRKEIFSGHERSVKITREKIKQYLDAPRGPRKISEEDRVGETSGLGINVELGVGSIIPVQATPIPLAEGRPGYLSMIHATGNIQKVMDESRKVATTAIFHCAAGLHIDLSKAEQPIHLHFMGGSSPKDGPSAGGAIALALASVLSGRPVRRDVAVTGEIDTQGRITEVGGLDIKLETAFDAGCKTLIIPAENLYGEGGIERLSEPLKNELQVLTYEQWRLPHDSFDHERHMLQIIAVDHILQVADIALIETEELKALDSRLVPHARLTAQELCEARRSKNLYFRAVYVKDVGELEVDCVKNHFWERGGNAFLVRSDVRDAFRGRFPELEEHGLIWDFDPAVEDLSSLLRKIEHVVGETYPAPVHLSVFAPFFFFVKQSPGLMDFSPSPAFAGLTLFANNYTVQEFKIKGCKASLNRAYYHISQLGPDLLDTCPFLRRTDGIYTVDLSFIPEKYRLDTKRAQEILNRSLVAWLETVESYCAADSEKRVTSRGKRDRASKA